MYHAFVKGSEWCLERTSDAKWLAVGDSGTLRLDRKTLAVTGVSQQALTSPSADSITFDALVGIFHGLRSYLVLATESILVATIPRPGTLPGRIHRVVNVRMIPADGDAKLSAEQREDDREYARMVQSLLGNGKFFFSPNYDLTLSTQRYAELVDAARSSGSALQPQWKQADERFFFNRALARPLLEDKSGAGNFVAPLISGFVSVNMFELKGTLGQLTIISRRSCRRSGKRFTTRGLDEEGNAANFAETEQLVFLTDNTSKKTRVLSFVQTRGSIPLLWQQVPTMKYTPKIQMHESEDASFAAFQLHVKEQTRLYGRTVMVSLINQKGTEGKLATAFAQQVKKASNPDIHLEAFDFHTECAKMKFENVAKLTAILKDDFALMGSFVAEYGPADAALTVVRRQTGVIRTNCIDCLDRTGVAQSAFARWVLAQHLAQFGLSSTPAPEPGQNSVFDGPLESLFKVAWSTNADEMSLLYAGTPALKSDYTRTGKRTGMGNAQDFVKSVTRYFVNNFYDGSAQDAIDLVLGLYVPRLDAPSPFAPLRQPSRSLRRDMGQLVVGVIAFIFLWGLLGPDGLTPHRGAGWFVHAVLFLIIFGAVAGQFVKRHGPHYTNKPLLRPHAFGTLPAGKDKNATVTTKKSA